MRYLSLPILLLAGACAGSPAAVPQADVAAKQFPPPSAGAGALYVYRSGLMGFARPVDVALSGGPSAQLDYNTFIRVDAPPGSVEVQCTVGGETGRSIVALQPGETRFVDVAMTPGFPNPGCEVAEAAPDAGRAAVTARRLVQPQ
ncbi:hypothetical protein [Reyranella sp.]|uniref:hypothetical protein n=1 Tax=Reyranella sp. TaxID=1929291 RepID=UPI003BABAB4A